MAKKYFLPRTDEGKLAWLQNFNSKLSAYTALFGITPAEVSAVGKFTNMFVFIMALLQAIKTFAQDVTQYKNILRSGPESSPLDVPPVFSNPAVVPTTVPAGIFIRIGRLVARIKAHDNYNTAIGEDLGLEGTEVDIDTSTWKPVISGKQVASRVEIEWPKGEADAIHFFVDRNDGHGFIFLATDTNPGYTDTAPMPAPGQTARWDYKAIYILNDEEVGEFSDIITVVVKGV